MLSALKNFLLYFSDNKVLHQEVLHEGKVAEFYYRGERIEKFLEKALEEGEYAILRYRNYSFYYLKETNIILYDTHIILKGILFSLKNRISYFDSDDFLGRNPKLKSLKLILSKKSLET